MVFNEINPCYPSPSLCHSRFMTDPNSSRALGKAFAHSVMSESETKPKTSPVNNSSTADGSRHAFPEVIELNVGGRFYDTTLMTLTKYRDSMLGAMFSGQHPQPKDKNGRYFIDADGDTFAHILRWLRHGTLPPKAMVEEVYCAAEFFSLRGLLDELDVMPEIAMKKVRASHLSNNFKDMDLSIKRVLHALVCVSTGSSRGVRPRLPVAISVRHSVSFLDLGPSHHCASSQWDDVSSTWRTCLVDVMLGPISVTATLDVTESVYVDTLVRELRWRGYVVQDKSVGYCRVIDSRDGEGGPDSPGQSCRGRLYYLVFSWE